MIGLAVRIVAKAVCSVLLAGSLAAQAQQPPKVHRIGFVTTTSPGTTIDPFRQGLREAGYIEGKNVIVEARFASGRQELLPELVADVIRQKVDVLVVVSTRTALAAKQATSTIPIVFASVFDRVASGIVQLRNAGRVRRTNE